MELLEFNLKELTQIETLLQIASNISNIYDKLYKLEINNKKDSQEYKEQLIKLNEIRAKENKIYREFNLTYYQCIKYLKLFLIQTKLPILDEKVSTTIKYNRYKIIRRISLIIYNIIKNNEEHYKNVMPKEFIDNILSSGENISFKSINNNTKVDNAINNDINNVFLNILQDFISQNEYQIYRKQLIQIKYCVIFSHKDLEDLLIENNFDILEKVYISSKIINEFLHEEQRAYDIIRFIELKLKAQQTINQLLEIKDANYKKAKTNIQSIISQSYIRALFSLMKDNEINEFNQEFQNYIQSPTYIAKYKNDRTISENIVLTCFKLFKHDQAKTRILSTKSNN